VNSPPTIPEIVVLNSLPIMFQRWAANATNSTFVLVLNALQCCTAEDREQQENLSDREDCHLELGPSLAHEHHYEDREQQENLSDRELK
jgi:hypothetical protein